MNVDLKSFSSIRAYFNGLSSNDVRILMPLVIFFVCLLGFFLFNPMYYYRSTKVLGRVPLLLWTQAWKWLPLLSLGLHKPLRVLA